MSAALAAGPLGIGDSVDSMNKQLIMSTCMLDGRLLKPSRPAMSLDSTIIQRTFGSGGPDGELWSAYTVVSTLLVMHLILWNSVQFVHLIPPPLPLSSLVRLCITCCWEPISRAATT